MVQKGRETEKYRNKNIITTDISQTHCNLCLSLPPQYASVAASGDLQAFPFRRYDRLSVTALSGLVTLTFDLLILELVRNVTRGKDNVHANFGASATYLSNQTDEVTL